MCVCVCVCVCCSFSESGYLSDPEDLEAATRDSEPLSLTLPPQSDSHSKGVVESR